MQIFGKSHYNSKKIFIEICHQCMAKIKILADTRLHICSMPQEEWMLDADSTFIHSLVQQDRGRYQL